MTGYLAGLIALTVLNALTFVAFGCDKWLARSGSSRLPEAVLLHLALVGGSPGAKLAQRHFHHKTRKQPFAKRLNAIVALHGLVLAVVAGAIYCRTSFS